MFDLTGRKTRIPHYGSFLAATVGLVLLFGSLRLALPLYRQQAVITDFRRRQLADVHTVPIAPAWLMQLVGNRWEGLLSEARVVVAPSRDQFIDRDLQQLALLARVQDLDLGSTKISDRGLVHLAGLTQLQRLSLEGTPVTDAGLRHLEHLTGLGVLTLQGSQVTATGVARLRNALPETMIVAP